MYFILGNSLSASGYHLCIHNETRNVSFLVMHTIPYTETKRCGGWLHWKKCTVTLYKMTLQTEYKTTMEQVTRCCSGYVQVGRYCARREYIYPSTGSKIREAHKLFCLSLDFKSLCETKKCDDVASHAADRQVISLTFQSVVLCARHQMEAQKTAVLQISSC